MARIGSNLDTAAVAPVPEGSTNTGFDAVNVDQFLNLLIAELQNQDPLNPMDNTQMLEQLSQIREIGATESLTNTLSAVVNGQNLSTASSLIGKQINALADDGETVSGVVDRVSVVTQNDVSTLRVHIGEAEVRLSNIRDIEAPES
ncbi:MAG: flagellar hook capping FlgD N-terminal domain-containing protein [Pirellulaceae bacterium]|jgi:flagellar basal-body rod modification protein FlgD|nr:flagellar hook capping FlgD N-terminal domain-containing protein [Pirellulaceae bacterium]MDP7016072.1 flagellar hook capping FlgD N-terminal domain-containing protein [Pirellulaceae bacterium]